MGFSIVTLYILVTLVSFILFLIGSIRLFRAGNIPGSKLIFFSLIGSVFSVFFPDTESVPVENVLMTEITEIAIISVLLLMAAFGFLRLAGYVVSLHTAKPSG